MDDVVATIAFKRRQLASLQDNPNPSSAASRDRLASEIAALMAQQAATAAAEPAAPPVAAVVAAVEPQGGDTPSELLERIAKLQDVVIGLVETVGAHGSRLSSVESRASTLMAAVDGLNSRVGTIEAAKPA